jgi:coenzyme F420 hydrogenase subunit beta
MLSDVPVRRMCTGCGNCVSGCPPGAVFMQDRVGEGLRPRFVGAATQEEAFLSFCPGYESPADLLESERREVQEDRYLGRFLEVWEGWAADSDIRFRASSGGVLSALSLYCLQREGVSGVLQVGADPARPWRNLTRLSTTREEIIRCAGSRYSPASPCEGLRQLEEQAAPAVFIGKPADATAAQLLRRARPALEQRLFLVLSMFCAGTPGTSGTLELLARLGVEPENLSSLSYRGWGWPGAFEATTKEGRRVSLPYEEAWGRLTHHKPMRENLEPDGFGRNADISCGDAWQVEDRAENPGVSVVVVRTELGRRILEKARQGGYLTLRPTTVERILSGQRSLVNKQREVFGRLLALRLFAMPFTRFPGFALKESWRELPLGRRARVLFGTVRRILGRRLWKPAHPGGER